jgi:cytochrome c553
MNKRNVHHLFAMLVIACLPQSIHAGDPALGKKAAARCVGCHGVSGISSAPNFPNLAGQKEAYLIKVIKDYRSGERNDRTMAAMVSPLSEEDIEHLAAYYSSLPAR